MARDYLVYGATLVLVKGSSSSNIAAVSQLGLAAEEIRIIPRFVHQDLRVNDYGDMSPDVMAMPADVTIRMTLVNVDAAVLETCLMESMGGANRDGQIVGAGTLMGGYHPLFSQNCHYISLNLQTEVLANSWRFKASYLASPPVEIPLSTKASLVHLSWRAIPYANGTLLPAEITSANQVLWDRGQIDT